MGMIWLVIGFGALLFRTVQLFFIKDVQTGPGLDDENHHRSISRRHALLPSAAYLLRGELIDPMDDRATSAKHLPNRRDA